MKMYWMLYWIFGLAVPNLRAEIPPESVKMGLELVHRSLRRNQQDLETLRKRVEHILHEGDLKKHLPNTLVGLVKEKQILRSAYHLPETKHNILLSTGIRQLIGSSNKSSVIEEAEEVIKTHTEHLLDSAFLLSLRGHAITVYKFALIAILLFADGVSAQEQPAFWNSLHFVYPIPLPESIRPVLASSVFVEKGRTFWLPNAGYVFGGDVQLGHYSERIRGLDCSALVSHLLRLNMRLSTLHMEQIYQLLPYRKEPPQQFLQRIKDTLQNDDEPLQKMFLSTLQQFARPIPINKTLLRIGDVVVWRTASRGHCAIFAGFVDITKTEFYAIEARRSSDQIYEGVVLGKEPLIKQGQKTCILRPRSKFDFATNLAY